MTIVIDASGEGNVDKAFLGIYEEIEKTLAEADYSEALRDQVVPILAAEHEEYFNREAGPDGPWAPLSPATVKAKGFDTILIETNRMRSSLLFSGNDHIEDISQAGLTWGTSDPKAAFHQDGTEKIPARPFVGASEETVDKIAEVIADAAAELISK